MTPPATTDSSAPGSPRRRRWLLAALRVTPLLVATTLALAVPNAAADNTDDRRVRAGARLLRSLLAADIGLDKRLVDGGVQVWVYAADRRDASEAAEQIVPPGDAATARLRDLALTATAHIDLPAGSDAPTAIFLASRPSNAQVDALVRWSIEHHAIVYSPFEGDVERGIPAGLSVEAKVQPFLNSTTLKAAGIELKPFFLQVAKVTP